MDLSTGAGSGFGAGSGTDSRVGVSYGTYLETRVGTTTSGGFAMDAATSGGTTVV